MDSDSTAKATTTECFNILYQTLEKYNERFVKASMTMTTVLFVVIGWLLTSSSVHDIFSDNLPGTIAALVVIAILIGIYTASMLRVYNVNHKVYSLLQRLNYVDEMYYTHHKLANSYKHFGLWVNIGFYLVIALLIANMHWQFL